MKREQFEHLCRLARLELADDEFTDFTSKFDKLLKFVEEIQAHDPEQKGEPLVLGKKLDFRTDTVKDFEWPEGARHDYRVPQVIDFDGGA